MLIGAGMFRHYQLFQPGGGAVYLATRRRRDYIVPGGAVPGHHANLNQPPAMLTSAPPMLPRVAAPRQPIVQIDRQPGHPAVCPSAGESDG